MATFIILNATKNPAYKPGDIVDDNTVDIRTVQTAGGALVATGDPVLDQVAAELQKSVVSLEAGAAIMLAAYTEFVQRGLAATDIDVAAAQADIGNGGVVGVAFATPAAALAQALHIGPRFGSVTLQATGVAGEWARWKAVLDACASIKVPVVMLGGAWLADTVQQMPSDIDLSMAPGVVITCSIGHGNGLTNSVFYRPNVILAGPLALQATAVKGAMSVVVTNAVATTLGLTMGCDIAIAQTNAATGAAYEVQSLVSGGGNTTIGLDRPTIHAWTWNGANAASISRIALTKNIKIHGNGAIITGIGDRAVQLMMARDCLVEDLRCVNVVNGFAGFSMSFDVGGFRNTFRKCEVDCANSIIMGIALESNEASLIDDCYVKGAVAIADSAGFFVFGGSGGTVRDCVAEHCNFGVDIDYLDGLAAYVPNDGARIEGGSFHHNVTAGIRVYEGALNTKLTGVDCHHNTSHGISLVNLTGVVTGTILDGCASHDNGGSGLYTGAGTLRTTINGCRFDLNARAGIEANGDVTVAGGGSYGCGAGDANSAGAMVLGAAGAVFEGYQINSGTNAVWNGFNVNTTGVVMIDGSVITMVAGGGTQLGIVNYKGTVYITNSRTIGGGDYGYIPANLAAAILWRGANCDFSASATPWGSEATSKANFGTFVANGATEVAVANTLATAGMRLRFGINTLGGTPAGAPFQSALTAATSFGVKCAAGDTSTYSYEITR